MIRSAKPDDAPFLAWAILTAGRGHLPQGWFDIALNRDEGECLQFIRNLTLSSARSLWHYSRFLIADESGCRVAAVSAYRARDAYPAATPAMVETIRTLGLSEPEAESIWRRGAYMFKCTMRPNADSWVIESLATAPAFRGRGYASELLIYALERGRVQGNKQAELSLLIGNESAERAYRHVGFELQQERRDATFEAISGAPGLRKFVKVL